MNLLPHVRLIFCAFFLGFAGPLSASANEDCLTCHGDSSFAVEFPSGGSRSLFASEAELINSSHSGFTCTDCHADLAGLTEYPHGSPLAKVDCGTCHADENSQYVTSLHGVALASGNPEAPTCASCHGAHDILRSDKETARTSKANLPRTCASCHSRYILTRDPDVRIANSYKMYSEGVHAKGIRGGINVAASCNDCHGTHDLRPAADIQSTVNRRNIPKTCSKCHVDIYLRYEKGIHGKALAAGITDDTAICTDCHGEHKILPKDDPASNSNPLNIAKTCSQCHNDERIIEKYGLAGQRLATYEDSYHGLATRRGAWNTANCASCHNAHDILPAANAESSINPGNLVRTCRRCHVTATANFAAGYTHKSSILSEQYSAIGEINRYVRRFYITMIAVFAGSFFLHNFIILIYHIIERYRKDRDKPYFIRFNRSEIIQHLRVTVAFILLVLTGFALRFPDAWWARLLSSLGMNEEVRSWVHRGAALLLIYTAIHHALYLLATKRGKIEFKAFIPRVKDVRDALGNIKYHLGLAKEKPLFDRFDYSQKLEYWSLVWGTFIMIGTGFVLWFPSFFSQFLPDWAIKISETVHYYEAWLATLAIFIFHFFMVMYHPEEYPMNITWITGRMSVEACEERHPLWIKKLKEEGKLEEFFPEPADPLAIDPDKETTGVKD
jgi:formate dehydrogenase gamma subunit